MYLFWQSSTWQHAGLEPLFIFDFTTQSKQTSWLQGMFWTWSSSLGIELPQQSQFFGPRWCLPTRRRLPLSTVSSLRAFFAAGGSMVQQSLVCLQPPNNNPSLLLWSYQRSWYNRWSNYAYFGSLSMPHSGGKVGGCVVYAMVYRSIARRRFLIFFSPAQKSGAVPNLNQK